MPGRKRLKRAGIFLAIIVTLLIGVALTHRLWLPYALRPAAARFGVNYDKFEWLPGGRFALHNVIRTNQNFDLSAQRIEGFLPDVWYRMARLDTTNQASQFLEINGWKVVVHDREGGTRDTTPAARERTVYTQFKQFEKILSQIRRWLPRATLLNGSIQHRDREYAFQNITWNNGRLEADGAWPISAVPIEVKARLSGTEPYQLSYAMHPLDLRARVQLWETNETLQTRLTAFYKDNTATANATFLTNSVWPATATVRATELNFPGELLKLDEYRELTGSITGNWESNQYTVKIDGHAEPSSNASVPAADLQLSARGNTNSVVVEQATSTIPGLTLQISNPVEFTYRGRMLSERAEIAVAAQLEKVPWLNATGRVEGTVVLERGDRFPKALLRARGTNIASRHLTAESVRIEGGVDWPLVEHLEVTVLAADNSNLRLSARGDLESRTLAEARVVANGQFITNLIPPTITYERVELEAVASGPITNLTHSGKVAVRQLATAHTSALDLQTAWSGRHISLEDLRVQARAGPAILALEGSVQLSPTSTNALIQKLTLSKGDEVYLRLREPSSLVITNEGSRRIYQLQPLIWEGEGKQLRVAGSLDWPRQGNISAEARNINPDLFQFFARRSLSGVETPGLVIEAHWNDGPLLARMRGEVSAEHAVFKQITAEVDLELDENGLSMTDLTVTDRTGEIASARGFLPLAIHPLDRGNFAHLSRRDELQFSLKTAPNQAFWQTISELLKVRLTNATVELSLTGTTRQPAGTLQFRTAGLELLGIERELPSIGAVEGSVTLNEKGLTIPSISARVEEQPLLLRGSVVLGTNFWSQRREEILKYLTDNASLELEAPTVQVAPFARFLPRHVAPQGTVSLDMGIKPGRELSGHIYLTELASRPLPKIGVVEDIRANIALSGREVQIANLQGMIGGEVLRLSGSVNFAETNMAAGHLGMNLRIHGTNVPLARNPDVILRSDLDLRVRNGTNGIPIVTGAATLRDSFLLRDIETLVPGRVAGPSRRPPYFSIEQDPIDDWHLNVQVRGDNFMRVRSPFFNGQVSANMNILGTAREPMALGEAAITSGRILFPFATLEVKQALVSLNSENPYLPNVFAVAAGRAFGYDIRMEAEGPASEPIIEFSSVPVLTSEQIILMLTTGQIPRDDFGFTNEEKASRLAFFLGKSFLSKLNPGKPAEERLTIRSGEDISDQGRQTYSVEYKINDRWSLIGEYDRFGALNADVKFKVFTR